MLDFRLLGPLEVVGENGPLTLAGTRQRATLAILLLSANRVVPIDRIADDLYAGTPPVTAVTQVHRQISELRKLLGSESSIETRSPGYVITVDPQQIDLKRFEHWTAEGATSLAAGDAVAAFERFSRALSLWRGEALADLRYESFAQPAIERLEELRVAATEQRVEAELLLGRHAELIPELEALAADYPLRERLHAHLMRALYAAGRHAEALDVYQAMRARFENELGIEPTPSLRALAQAILRHDPELATRSSPVPGRAAPAPVLVVAHSPRSAADLLSAAVPIAGPDGEVVVACLLDDASRLRETAAQLNGLRESVDGAVRTATFTSADPVHDVIRLASAHDAAVVLLEHEPSEGRLPDWLARILLRCPADVAFLTQPVDLSAGDGIYVVFGGNEHDWSGWRSRRGSPAWRSRRCGSSERRARRRAGSAMRADSLPPRHLRSSGSPASRASRSLPKRRRTGWLRLCRRRPSSSRASRRAGARAGSAPHAGCSRTGTCRRWSCTVDFGRGSSLRGKPLRVTRGRSRLEVPPRIERG